MKKFLLIASAFVLANTGMVKAQNAQHLALYEEFTGENCPPCASSNPGLWTLAEANTSKMLLLKYQTDIPSATNPNGIYNKTNAQTNFVPTRISYYSTPFAPYGRLDGIILQGTSNPGHVAWLTQARIDSVYNLSAGLAIQVVSFKFSKNNDSIYATVKITAPAAFAPSGANLKLRAGFIQTLNYSAAADAGSTHLCGTNGETVFENVIRQMLPDAGGTAIPSSWTANQSQTVTLAAKLMSHITLKAHDETPFFAVWVQNETDKRVVNAARSLGNDFPTNVPTAENGINSVSIYPNPATSYATIKVDLAKSTPMQLTVRDAIGRLVYTQSEVNMTAGSHEITISTQGYAAGIYKVTINSNIGSTTQGLSIQ
jgi:hypothetical protein